MTDLDFNDILERDAAYETLSTFLDNFDKHKKEVSIHRGVYVYGPTGSGKTHFVKGVFKDMGYDVVEYDAGEVRNKHIMNSITKGNMSDKSVMGMFSESSNKRRIVIVMDEIDGMNNGDKGGINSLIKLIRPKKTKKQRAEPISTVPIVCIGSIHMDKKMKELLKVCVPVQIHKPNGAQMGKIVKLLFPDISEDMQHLLIAHAEDDLNVILNMHALYTRNNDLITEDALRDIFRGKGAATDSKNLARNCIVNPLTLGQHLEMVNETDRTIVALLWHENIIDVLESMPREQSIILYDKLLKNMCFADYIDRITFQKQIWQFNEMSSLVKTFYTNHILHEAVKAPIKQTSIRFTKVLTKYSTEYNNQQFVITLCKQLNMDKKDLFSYLSKLRKEHTEDEIAHLLEIYEVSKLDISRLFRYLDKRSSIAC